MQSMAIYGLETQCGFEQLLDTTRKDNGAQYFTKWVDHLGVGKNVNKILWISKIVSFEILKLSVSASFLLYTIQYTFQSTIPSYYYMMLLQKLFIN